VTVAETDHQFDVLHYFAHAHVLSHFDSVNALTYLHFDHEQNFETIDLSLFALFFSHIYCKLADLLIVNQSKWFELVDPVDLPRFLHSG
jgi:hypothetical protein